LGRLTALRRVVVTSWMWVQTGGPACPGVVAGIGREQPFVQRAGPRV